MPLVQGLLLQVNVERPANQFRLREEAGAPWKAGKGSEGSGLEAGANDSRHRLQASVGPPKY